MSTISYCIMALCLVLAGFMLFSLCSNLIYWYENLNTPECPIPLPKPGVLFCLCKFFISLGGYILCVGLFPFGPFLALRPRAPKNGKPGLPPVILIHGLNNNAAVWLYLSRKLEKQGYPVSTFSYSSLFVPLNRILNRLDAHIREVEGLHPGQKPFIVGHSLGGILVRTWLLRPENPERPGGLVTIGTPHGGSKLAVFAPGALARNLRPGSELLAALEQAPAAPFPCTALASPVDEAVLPASRLVPPLPPHGNWKLRIAAPVGHFTLLFHPRTAALVLEELNACGSGSGRGLA